MNTIRLITVLALILSAGLVVGCHDNNTNAIATKSFEIGYLQCVADSRQNNVNYEKRAYEFTEWIGN